MKRLWSYGSDLLTMSKKLKWKRGYEEFNPTCSNWSFCLVVILVKWFWIIQTTCQKLYKMNHVPLSRGKIQRWKRLKHWDHLGMKIMIRISWKLSRPIKTVLKLMSHPFREKDGDQSALTITSNLQLITSLKVTSRYFIEFIWKLWIVLFKQSKHVLIKQIGLFTRSSKRFFWTAWKVSRFKKILILSWIHFETT